MRRWGSTKKGKKECQGRKTLRLNVVYMGTIAILSWHKWVIFASYVVMSPVGATPVVPARGKRQACCKGFRGRLVCCSSPRSLPRHQPDQILTSLPPTCKRAKVNCAYLHLRCAKCAMVQPQGVPRVQMWAGSMNYPTSTVGAPASPTSD